MKKLVGALAVLAVVAACNEESKTAYYYMQHEEELTDTLNKCISGELDRYSQNCETVKLAREYVLLQKQGLVLSEKQLKELGKK